MIQLYLSEKLYKKNIFVLSKKNFLKQKNSFKITKILMKTLKIFKCKIIMLYNYLLYTSG